YKSRCLPNHRNKLRTRDKRSKERIQSKRQKRRQRRDTKRNKCLALWWRQTLRFSHRRKFLPSFSDHHLYLLLLHVLPLESSMAASTPSRSSSSTAPLESRFQRHVISGCKTEPSALALKRKRPMMIDIPVESLMERRGWTWWRLKRMVTRYIVREGEGVPWRIATQLLSIFAMIRDRPFLVCLMDMEGQKQPNLQLRMDRNIKDRLTCGSEEKIMEAVKMENVGSGACCVTALMQKGNLVVSNAGDCRAVMSRGGVAEALTSDHHPSRVDERARIETTGGYVDCCRGVWRIQGSLAVSRAIEIDNLSNG
ncbi:Protein phosphatase 2C family protein, partial [Prunus dulcis]